MAYLLAINEKKHKQSSVGIPSWCNMDLFCNDCSLQYEQKRLTNIHPSCIYALYKRKKELSNLPTAPPETEGLNHKCPTCEFHGPCKGVLKKHVEANHKREFKCSTCNFSTPQKTQLKIHQGSVLGRFEYVPLSAIMYMLIFFFKSYCLHFNKFSK